MALMRHLLRLRSDCLLYTRLLAKALALRATDKDVTDALVERIVIALHDSFAVAARNVVLTSAVGNTVTRTGKGLARVPTLAGVSGPMDFLRERWALNKKMSRSWEPDWFIPQNAIRAATLLQVGNELQIANGLGASTSPERLRITRNVIAHSLPNTWQRFRQLNNDLGINPIKFPSDLVLSYNPSTTNRYLEDWIVEIELSVAIAIE